MMRGMDSGFSSCAAPAFCHGPGISRDRWVYARERAAGRLLGQRMRQESFQRRKRKNSGVEWVKQFPEEEILRGRELKSHRRRVTIESSRS